MKLPKCAALAGLIVAWMMASAPTLAADASPPRAGSTSAGGRSPWLVDHRYAPRWWQTSICLPDDWQKTLVGKEGTLLYDYPGKYSGFKTRITLGFGPEAKWVRQELVSPRVPIVRTVKRLGSLEIMEQAFAAAPPLRWDETKTAKPVAVEVNLQLVPRHRHAEHRLAEGDRLEIVTLVGGG